MKKFGLYVFSACGLLLLPVYLGAQSSSVQPSEARPAATPEPVKTNTTTQRPSELQVEIGASYEYLTNDRPGWQSYYVFLNQKMTSGQVLYGSASVVRRFELTDPNLMVGFVQPLGESKRWLATFELEGSPSHKILPTVALFGQIDRIIGKGWVGHAGLRYRRYPSDDVSIGVFGVEKYIKAYRGAYNLYVARLHGKGTAVSHAFQGNYYYGERNSVGLGGAFGQEIESIPGGLVRTDVLEFSVVGRHWIDQRWGLSYVGVWHRQGTVYTRSGAQVGLLLRF